MKKEEVLNNLLYKSRTVVVNLPHTRYVDRVLRSDSFEQLRHLFMNADSPAKEISESMGAFNNMRKFINMNNKTWLHIGDGAWGRTAAIFTMYSKSINYSIDPNINFGRLHGWMYDYKIRGFHPIMSKFQDVSEPEGGYCITNVHGHVDLKEVDQHFPNWRYLYSNPCCYPSTQTFPDDYMKERGIVCIKDDIDLGILSERRRVLIYKKLTLNESYV